MQIADHIDALEQDGVLLADAAEEAGLFAEVPACGGWQVRDLVRHLAYVHGWAARHVAEECAEVIEGPDEAEALRGGPPDGQLLGAYRQGHAALVKTLRDADPGVQCATFLPAPSPLAFWARRQAHETAIHRLDAQSAAPGRGPAPAAAFAPAFAVDGIDELIMGFVPRMRRLRGGTWSLAVRATDAPGRWLVRPAAGAIEVTRVEASEDDAAADCALAGPASSLYAFLWNRCTAGAAGLEASGDLAVLGTWHDAARIRWT
jgi:uncharacterized protein (TIGR03083 family)